MFSRWIETNNISARGTLHSHKTRITCRDQLVICGLYKTDYCLPLFFGHFVYHFLIKDTFLTRIHAEHLYIEPYFILFVPRFLYLLQLLTEPVIHKPHLLCVYSLIRHIPLFLFKDGHTPTDLLLTVIVHYH
jgi:hypothetical protein